MCSVSFSPTTALQGHDDDRCKKEQEETHKAS